MAGRARSGSQWRIRAAAGQASGLQRLVAVLAQRHAENVKEAQALGLKVLPWTVNNPSEMTRLIDMGVDGLITDYPDRAQPVLAAKGLTFR